MKKIPKTLVILAVIAVGAVFLYRTFFPTYTYRYRMTVNVDTPQGARTGLAVLEIKREKQI